MKIIYCTKEEHVSKGASTASNIAERLFSTVRHDFNDYRKKLTNKSGGADIPQGKQKILGRENGRGNGKQNF